MLLNNVKGGKDMFLFIWKRNTNILSLHLLHFRTI